MTGEGHRRILAVMLFAAGVLILFRGPSAEAGVGRPVDCPSPILVDEELYCDLDRAAAVLGEPTRALREGQSWTQGSATEMSPHDLAALDVPIDPNTATADALTSLPGVGPITAERIIEARPFTRADGLRRVHGIGPITLERMRSRLAL